MKYWRIKILYSSILAFLLCFYQNVKAGNVIRDVEIESFFQEIAKPMLIADQMQSRGGVFKSQNSTIEKASPIYRPTFYTNYIPAIPVYKIGQTQSDLASGIKPLAVYGNQTDELKLPKIDILFINQPEINAFATGSDIYIYSGLIEAYDNSNLFRGVLAHELSHVLLSHALRGQIARSQAAKQGVAGGAMTTLLLAASGGAAAALIGGTAIATGHSSSSVLSHSREFETEADSKAMLLLSRSNSSVAGILDLMTEFKKNIRSDIPDLFRYFTTHPLPDERFNMIERYYNMEDKSMISTDLKIEEKFQRVKAKILGLNKKQENKITINSNKSGMPTGLSNRVEFYNLYRNMFYCFANSEYEKAINIANRIYSLSDPYINETLAQSYCSLGNIANANYYFHITKSLLNNNKLIEYEHADCLVRFGKESDDVKNGIEKLYVLFTTDYKYYNIGDLIKHACDKINNSGVEGLSDLISAMQFYNAGKITEAKLSIEKAIAAKNFHDSKYYEQIKKYYTMLKNDEQQN